MTMHMVPSHIDTSSLTKEETHAWSVLAEVMDPEVPVLSIIDLGIVRAVEVEDADVAVTITPTYTGCPAMDMIRVNIKMEMMAAGFKNVTVKQVLSPAWTTDWMSEAGKEKLKAYGIAAPLVKQQVCHQELFAPDEAIQCPHCDSWHTRRISEFGSTACKALYQCNDCLEPFDYFKCH
ncbi:MAG TPA: 1,2-phenylacetyl-CoA epoxidase subunit PaaD [Chitinophagaceae bacterium]|nr:1,2-phenylacetyl-CoA epoxidase subunit PaaD [Chitinophagaceae bacterium]